MAEPVWYKRQLLSSGLAIALAGGLTGWALSQTSEVSLLPLSEPVFPSPSQDESLGAVPGTDTIVLAGGCFWGVEAIFEHLNGVTDVVTGYAGGSAGTASYDEVSSGESTHAESVEITYDPSQISVGQLLEVFFAVAHDPTQLNRQGPNVGSQYRSAIFFTRSEQQKIAQAYMEQLSQAHVFKKPIVTELVPLQAFYPAEAYHQDFIARNPDNPYVMIHDLPKISQFKQQFKDWYRP